MAFLDPDYFYTIDGNLLQNLRMVQNKLINYKLNRENKHELEKVIESVLFNAEPLETFTTMNKVMVSGTTIDSEVIHEPTR